MNRRQVLFGASATAALFGGFVPWASAQGPVSMSVTFTPFTDGIRGTYTLNGQVTLAGTIPPVVPGPSSAAVPAPAAQPAFVQEAAAPPAPVPPVAATQYAAPARPPMMSIVTVPRGSAANLARSPD